MVWNIFEVIQACSKSFVVNARRKVNDVIGRKEAYMVRQPEAADYASGTLVATLNLSR